MFIAVLWKKFCFHSSAWVSCRTEWSHLISRLSAGIVCSALGTCSSNRKPEMFPSHQLCWHHWS